MALVPCGGEFGGGTQAFSLADVQLPLADRQGGRVGEDWRPAGGGDYELSHLEPRRHLSLTHLLWQMSKCQPIACFVAELSGGVFFRLGQFP